MPPLVGRHVNKVDRKGRVSVPKPFRDVLKAEDAAASRIYAYPLFSAPAIEACGEGFMNRVAESIEELDMFSERQDDLASVLLEHAHALPFDPEGRVVLPEELLTHANIDGEVVFVGRGARFQIWNPEAYEARRRMAFERARASGATLKLVRETGA
ncbi:MAG: division/cell wall cluster transcriptional repressor MraZ [Rhodospirillales bacterium]|nr:MAG: division/cell wall cluster transcriptional repressor MraZ [Rhodospirillales bacterium]